jgi:hypothetical protein
MLDHLHEVLRRCLVRWLCTIAGPTAIELRSVPFHNGYHFLAIRH